MCSAFSKSIARRWQSHEVDLLASAPTAITVRAPRYLTYGSIVKLSVAVAASYSPVCSADATMVQVPAAISVAVLPDTVQVAVDVEA